MEENNNVEAFESVDVRIKALRSSSTRLRSTALKRILQDIEAGEILPRGTEPKF